MERAGLPLSALTEFEIINVSGDGNCCFFVIQQWLHETGQRGGVSYLEERRDDGNISVTDFRKKTRHYLETKEEVLRDETNPVSYFNYHHFDSIWSELLEKVYPSLDQDFQGGCSSSQWVGMAELAFLLILKYKVKTMVIYNLSADPAMCQTFSNHKELEWKEYRKGDDEMPSPILDEYHETISAFLYGNHFWLIRPRELYMSS